VTSRAPRVAPGTREQIGWANFTLARLIGLATGSGPPNVFTTLARHRRIFRRWLRFAAALMPGGILRRVDTELLILRVAHNCDCRYEWQHHERLGRAAGLSAEQIDATRGGPGAAGLSSRQLFLLRAADELHTSRTLGDETWTALRDEYSEVELIELCLLVGHYEMLAMTLNALAVQPDPRPMKPPGKTLRLLRQRIPRGRRQATS
jgi:AhpD family alkylhydroperoxidase